MSGSPADGDWEDVNADEPGEDERPAIDTSRQSKTTGGDEMKGGRDRRRTFSFRGCEGWVEEFCSSLGERI